MSDVLVNCTIIVHNAQKMYSLSVMPSTSYQVTLLRVNVEQGRFQTELSVIGWMVEW